MSCELWAGQWTRQCWQWGSDWCWRALVAGHHCRHLQPRVPTNRDGYWAGRGHGATLHQHHRRQLGGSDHRPEYFSRTQLSVTMQLECFLIILSYSLENIWTILFGQEYFLLTVWTIWDTTYDIMCQNATSSVRFNHHVRRCNFATPHPLWAKCKALHYNTTLSKN